MARAGFGAVGMKAAIALLAASAVAAAGMAAARAAEPFPSRPMRIVTVLPVGSDTYVRAVGARLSELLGQPLIVENRLGASGAIGLQAVVGAAPDGHTLMIHSPAFLIARSVQAGAVFEAVADLTPVAQIYGASALVLSVRSESGAKSIEDLVARGASGKLSYGSGGAGFPAHLAAEAFLLVTRTRALHVPFKSTAEYLQALIRGDVDFALGVSTSSMAQVKSGRLRALGVTSAERLRDLPDVPTLREVLKSELLVQEFWAGLAAPAKTPADIVRSVHAATVKALGDPAVRRSIEATGSVPVASESPEAFAALIRREGERWREIVKLTGVKAE
jgi:tripartite-type tricarboxylate transporter receptor subunit TctC